MDKNWQFIGDRIYLRPLTAADATETYASWLNDSEVNKFLATKSATISDLRDYIAKKNAQKDARLFGIFLKASNQHIGTVKLEPLDIEHKKATIAIMIGDRHSWGRGLGPEAMRLLIDYCFKDLNFSEVNLGVLGQNVAAIKSYKKLGFQEIKREIGVVKYPNGIFDQVTMVLKRKLYA